MKLVIQLEFNEDIQNFPDAAAVLSNAFVKTFPRNGAPGMNETRDIYSLDGETVVGKWEVTGDPIDDFTNQLA